MLMRQWSMHQEADPFADKHPQPLTFSYYHTTGGGCSSFSACLFWDSFQ